MKKKLLVMIFMITVVFVGAISAHESSGVDADAASKFDIGNYSYADLMDQNFKAYMPTLRFQLNVHPWFDFSVHGLDKKQTGMRMPVDDKEMSPTRNK